MTVSRDQILALHIGPNFGVVTGADLEYEDTNPFLRRRAAT